MEGSMKSRLTLIPQNYDREMRYYKREEGRVGERERERERERMNHDQVGFIQGIQDWVIL